MCNFPIGLAGFSNLKRSIDRSSQGNAPPPAKFVCKDGLCRPVRS